MNINELCVSIGQSLPPLFVCSPAPQEGMRVRTPMLYPDGDIVDVFVLERDSGYTITDFGDALGWLGLQSVSRQRSPKQQMLIQDVCQTLRIELFQDQLVVRQVMKDVLGESVLRLAQAAVRVSDLWFTFRSQSFQNTADEVDEWLREKQIPFDRQVTKHGRSTQNWTIDFETHTDNRTSLVFPSEHRGPRDCPQAGRTRPRRMRGLEPPQDQPTRSSIRVAVRRYGGHLAS